MKSLAYKSIDVISKFWYLVLDFHPRFHLQLRIVRMYKFLFFVIPFLIFNNNAIASKNDSFISDIAYILTEIYSFFFVISVNWMEKKNLRFPLFVTLQKIERGGEMRRITAFFTSEQCCVMLICRSIPSIIINNPYI